MGVADAKGKNNGEGNRARKEAQTKRDETREALFFLTFLPRVKILPAKDRLSFIIHTGRSSIEDINATA